MKALSRDFQDIWPNFNYSTTLHNVVVVAVVVVAFAALVVVVV